MTFDHDYAEKIQAAKNRDLRSKSELSAGLANCPFCGDAVELEDKDAVFVIECRKCNTTMSCFNLEILVNRWNHRVG